FANQSSRFIDAYHKGLNSKQAAWANKKYHGHCVLPKGILKELDEHHISYVSFIPHLQLILHPNL
ncbi:hypothetical protein PAXRUDRAFT_152912, partial [Paxillus rubicundulus Ve08.2h10]